MNSYDLANRLEEFYKGTHIEKAAETLRQQADRIADLETALAFIKKIPLSEEEIIAQYQQLQHLHKVKTNENH